MIKVTIIVLITFLIITIAIILIRKYINKTVLKFQNDLISKHHEEVKNLYTDMRGWKHDFHNHIQVIKAYVDLNKIDKLKSYMEKLDEDLNNIDFLIRTGNITIDAILNSKISLARSNKIKVDVTASAPKKLAVSDIDLCVIIGNLIENAIEASMKVQSIEKRFIRIYIGIFKKQFYISISNSTCEKKKRITAFISSKGANHGLGLKRIDNTVKKYNGFINRQNEPGVFATEVMLPL